ncbi:N-acetyltransferase family protein [Phaeobacter sp. C3_T13_0]|uniref:GNAT family N-acetyltransferase n=1 Tax=Phaeobacter cretensis TaxID=3342641 RepID=UPI0039BC42E7
MSAILVEVLNSWQSTRPGDPSHVLDYYISHPDRIDCAVCEKPGVGILGFQSLRLATPGNQYNVEPGWGIIGTYVSLGMGRLGIGAALFQHSLRAAQDAGLTWIEATIALSNPSAQKYYGAMGFQIYKTDTEAVRKRCRVSPPT